MKNKIMGESGDAIPSPIVTHVDDWKWHGTDRQRWESCTRTRFHSEAG